MMAVRLPQSVLIFSVEPLPRRRLLLPFFVCDYVVATACFFLFCKFQLHCTIATIRLLHKAIWGRPIHFLRRTIIRTYVRTRVYT